MRNSPDVIAERFATAVSALIDPYKDTSDGRIVAMPPLWEQLLAVEPSSADDHRYAAASSMRLGIDAVVHKWVDGPLPTAEKLRYLTDTFYRWTRTKEFVDYLKHVADFRPGTSPTTKKVFEFVDRCDTVELWCRSIGSLLDPAGHPTLFVEHPELLDEFERLLKTRREGELFLGMRGRHNRPTKWSADGRKPRLRPARGIKSKNLNERDVAYRQALGLPLDGKLPNGLGVTVSDGGGRHGGKMRRSHATPHYLVGTNNCLLDAPALTLDRATELGRAHPCFVNDHRAWALLLGVTVDDVRHRLHTITADELAELLAPKSDDDEEGHEQ
jgi:hypothetical protein